MPSTKETLQFRYSVGSRIEVVVDKKVVGGVIKAIGKTEVTVKVLVGETRTFSPEKIRIVSSRRITIMNHDIDKGVRYAHDAVVSNWKGMYAWFDPYDQKNSLVDEDVQTPTVFLDKKLIGVNMPSHPALAVESVDLGCGVLGFEVLKAVIDPENWQLVLEVSVIKTSETVTFEVSRFTN